MERDFRLTDSESGRCCEVEGDRGERLQADSGTGRCCCQVEGDRGERLQAQTAGQGGVVVRLTAGQGGVVVR